MALVRAEPRAATVTAQGPLKALVLSRITFTRLLGPLQERLALEMERREVEHSIIHFADLELRQTIGVGSFAQIRLVVHKPSQVRVRVRVRLKRSTLGSLRSPSCCTRITYPYP